MIEKGFTEGIGAAVQDWAQTRTRSRGLMSDCCGVYRRAFVSFSVYRAREASSAFQRLVDADLYRGETPQKNTRRASEIPGRNLAGRETGPPQGKLHVCVPPSSILSFDWIESARMPAKGKKRGAVEDARVPVTLLSGMAPACPHSSGEMSCEGLPCGMPWSPLCVCSCPLRSSEPFPMAGRPSLTSPTRHRPPRLSRRGQDYAADTHPEE
jgi:hypothetical protein